VVGWIHDLPVYNGVLALESADELILILPDGRRSSFPPGVTPLEVARRFSPEVAERATCARVGGVLWDLSRPLERGGEISFLTFDDPEGREVYRHTAAHVLAQAVKRVFPEARLAIGPPLEDGFYYDIDPGRSLDPDDLLRIEEEIGRIVEEDLPIRREALSREEALSLFRERGEDYKVEMIREIPPGEEITVYRQGEFVDLCRGPHLPSTGRLGRVKLLTVAGAYWRGDERRPMLQRIYGTAYETPEQLNAHLQRLEEARKRDHRRLGRELDLFSLQEEGGGGLVFWHPRGAAVREVIEEFWRKEHRRRGYQLVYTPHIARLDLWKVSGHWDWYRENMYPPMELEGVDYLLKPMNCPLHILIYRSRVRSYRDLPLRWAELGTVYRFERSGVLHGLLRVRGFTQDDAHIFCREDQLEEEVAGVLDLARFMLRSFGFPDWELTLSVRDPQKKEKYIGGDAVWEKAEEALRRALERLGLDYRVEEGEAKFYGPAIDVRLKDALGRGWQGPTIQVDFNLPARFDLGYTGPDGRIHRPVMVHRTVLGSLERFLGALTEQCAGAFPLWLSPVQVRVLPVLERHLPYAHSVLARLREEGFRAEVDGRPEKLSARIRDAQMEKIPYMLVVGDAEKEGGAVSVRARAGGQKGTLSLDEFIRQLREEASWPSL